MPTRALLGVLALSAAVGCSATSTPTGSTAPPPPARAHAGGSTQGATTAKPCGTAKHATYRHVVWIFLENRTYSSVLGPNGEARNLQAFGRECGVATNYTAITHPSLPNYVAAVSGSTGGITTDCTPEACPQNRKSLYGQTTAHGMTWRGFAESMKTNCDHGSYGKYAARHNPAVYFTPLAQECSSRDVAMGGAHGAFANALAKPHLPSFAFVTPNLCNDGHDCATTVTDDWLQKWLPRITRSAAYRAGNTAVFITWDEGVGADNQVATVVMAPTVPPHTRVGTAFTHYSLLRTTEELLGLPLLRNARQAASMRRAFHLG